MIDRSPQGPRFGLLAPLALTASLLVLERVGGNQPQFIGVLTAVPLLAAALTGPLATALAGSVALLGGFLVGFTEYEGGRQIAFTESQGVRLAFIAGATVLGVGVSVARRRALARYRRMASVADAAQRAIMRPTPAAVGPVECASTYLSSASEASIGGDLVEVLDTPFGVRAVVGDVRGKGMDAVRLAGLVLGSFREAAWSVPDLRDLTVPLDRAVRRDAGPEDFVTAVLVQLTWDGVVTVCSCGHPEPFVVGPDDGPATPLPTEPSPPLGMVGTTPRATTARLAAGQRLVLVTDGLLEARQRRRLSRAPGPFLPAEEVLGRSLSTGPLGPGLDRVVEEVRAWTRGRLRDDLAVLVLQVREGSPRRARGRA